MTDLRHLPGTPSAAPGAISAADALRHAETAHPAFASARLRPYPTGFEPLDDVLDGGLRAHDLALIGGLPGVGKTVAALQWARNMALAGRSVLYVCYEHDANVLLARLLCLELGLAANDDIITLEKLRTAVHELSYGGGASVLTDSPEFAEARERFAAYADHLLLIRASGAHTGLEELRQLLQEHAREHSALFVDYLQKVAVRPEPPTEADKVTHIAEGLKDIALSYDVPIVAVVAAEKAGLDARRLRLHHLRGSSALAYEADVALILNDKMQAVSKVHLAYDAVRAQTFRNQVVFSIEKNRGGPALIDLEFRKEFANYRFDPKGAYVQDRLVDERFDEA